MPQELNKNMLEFNVSIYGDLEQYNDVISKARCRIFYKYANRNGTYITDEFADKLASSLPYTPVKGIYDEDSEDYTNHGSDRSLGRIYGVVPENPNFAWEDQLDEDGVIRRYACTDVLLFTAIYKEAGDIVGKAQSMELYEKSVKGNWQYIQGRRQFVFTDGCFLGLQVLGEESEPCFEGAAFFSLYTSLKSMIQEIQNYELSHKGTKGGIFNMENINFKLSDNQKYNKIWSSLNPNFTEEGGWTAEYSVCDIYDQYAVVYNLPENSYERVYYTKDDSTDSLSLGERKKCYIVDVTESEKNALETIQALNGGTYEKIDEKFNEISNLEEKVSEFEQKIEEKDTAISTLTTERDQFSTELEEVRGQNSTLNGELEELKTYKLGIETAQKDEIIARYSEQLPEEAINRYMEKVADYSIADLEKDLAFELVKSNPSIFTKNTPTGYVPSEDGSQDGVEAILAKYKK